MIWYGLSVLQRPFWTGPLTKKFKDSIIGDIAGDDFVLVDGGNYLGQIFPEWGNSGRLTRHIRLYYRLNPDQPDGRFHGQFDHLAGQ